MLHFLKIFVRVASIDRFPSVMEFFVQYLVRDNRLYVESSSRMKSRIELERICVLVFGYKLYDLLVYLHAM